MSKVVPVTRADVARAQLVVKLNESLGRTTPLAIHKIAEATRAGGSDENGNGDSNAR